MAQALIRHGDALSGDLVVLRTATKSFPKRSAREFSQEVTASDLFSVTPTIYEAQINSVHFFHIPDDTLT
jgi:hypothetical protein